MNIFTEIEKLINEHGSAAILKERIALAREQNEALVGEVKSLKTELAALKTIKAEIESELKELRQYTDFENLLKFNEHKGYYEITEGNRTGKYCPVCHDDRNKLIRLQPFQIHPSNRGHVRNFNWICPTCDFTAE